MKNKNKVPCALVGRGKGGTGGEGGGGGMSGDKLCYSLSLVSLGFRTVRADKRAISCPKPLAPKTFSATEMTMWIVKRPVLTIISLSSSNFHDSVWNPYD